MTKQEFKELVAKGKVVLDGATGSNLMKAAKRCVFRSMDL